MIYQVYLIDTAEDDLFEIYSYILKNDSKKSADHVLSKIEKICDSLERMPQRGHVPPELSRINVNQFLELHFKPYRIIYEIETKKVFVHGVFDGRRDLQDLLSRRLLR